MIRTMSLKAEINPPLTNHCVRAISVTILSDANVETRHIKCVTGHKYGTSILSYSTKPSFQPKEKMSTILSSFIGGENFSTPHEAGSADRWSKFRRYPQELPSCSSSTAGKYLTLRERPAAVDLNDHSSKSKGILPGVSSKLPISRLFGNHCEQ